MTNLEFTVSTRRASQTGPSALGLQDNVAMPSFLCKCWGSKLRSSSFQRKSSIR